MLSYWKSAAGVLANVSKTLIKETNVFTQQKRNAIILRRMYPIGLYKKGKRPPKLKHRNFIYESVENTHIKPKPPIDMILTTYVEGVGDKGDKISIKPMKAYRDYLLPGLAVYATPENVNKFLVSKEARTYSSKAAPMTIKFLRQLVLPVFLSLDNPWTLEKWHIKAMFQRLKIQVPEEAITMPEQEIKGPNLDYQGKEFYVTVTINKTESVKVRCRVFHISKDFDKQPEYLPGYKTIPGKAILPEDQEILDSMPRPRYETSTQTNETLE